MTTQEWMDKLGMEGEIGIKDTKSFTLTTEQTLDDFAKLRVIEKLEEIKRNFEGTATARLMEKELLKLRGLDR